MTLNQLGYFYQAAVLQHFNQAAEKINISEPSLSRSITALENELGVTLFEKRGRNVTLTKAGEIFLEHVTQILDDVTRASNKMQQIATNGGHIDIAYVSPLAREFIPNTVRSFLSLEQNKNITFHFFQDITSMNIEGLKKGSYDLIFGSYSANEPNIEFIPIIKQDLVAILPIGHPLCKKDEIEAGDFQKYPVLASLVAKDFGIALVADVDTIHRDDICIRPLISQETFSHTVYMGYMRGKYQLPAVQRFIQFVRRMYH